MKLSINTKIEIADTLPGKFYGSPEIFNKSKEAIFMKSWQYSANLSDVKTPQTVYPFYFLKDYIDEPLILVRDENDELHCLSNVCTHRGNILVEGSQKMSQIRCCYHGRLFKLNGKMKSMPEFSETKNFPSKSDDLPAIPFQQWGQFIFCSLNPGFNFETAFNPMIQRVNFLPLDQLVYDSSRSHEYLVRSNWALYCENYLEGFHIPYVHKGLSSSIDYKNYTYEIFEYSNLQIGIVKEGTEVFNLPAGHIDKGKRVGAYYFWVFPNMMFNFYPWGLSFNIVNPLAPELTKVSFKTYILDVSKLDKGAGAQLDTVEREDEEIVERVQKGVNSMLYKKGRYSAKMEKGVHHFHKLLSTFLS